MGKQNNSLNYIYFAVLFLCLSFLHVYQIFLIDDRAYLHRTFYIIYAIGQCFLEVGVLALVGNFLVTRYPRSLNPVFIGCTVVLFIIHILDFPVVRMMNVSVWYWIDLISSESFENFVEMLYASNISIKIWVIAALVALILPILGIVFFRLTDGIVKKRPLNFSYTTTALSLMAIVLFLSMFDFKTGQLAAPANESRYLNALPWKTTLFSHNYLILPLKGTLPPLPPQEELAQKLATTGHPLHRPNIFLFVIESLREDYIIPENAPAFSKFKHDNVAFPISLSSANCTQDSWFSIFHSHYPFYRNFSGKTGSFPLQVLKKAGYQVHVYSSARFNYYHMDEVLFGKEHALADTFHLFAHDGIQESHESDGNCIARLMDDMHRLRGEDGHIFLIFLDATHFDYSWPRRDVLQFTPIVEQVDYFKVAFSQENIEGIKNRYRNAIFYLDTLFGQFHKKLETMADEDRSVVVLTGDHGESFFEDGHIFHASNLSKVQTHVPIYYRLGKESFLPIPAQTQLTSHLDIFPTILNYVFGVDLFPELFDGESIFQEKKRPFAVAARYNASRAPFEFFIHNGKDKLVARFSNQRDIFKSRALQILGKRNDQDEPQSYDISLLEAEFGTAINALFSKK
jgi:glucan phosphoethanolaminetransferase (alkaline phosphatase superfamily)